MGKFSLLNHFHHFWQAYVQMMNRHIKNKKPAKLVYNKKCTYLQNLHKLKAYKILGGFEKYFDFNHGQWNSDNLCQDNLGQRH